jgi:ectoine hydroxylase-related dioxygenase (phytanoyl-CoA dioxygenase family)
MKPIVKPSIHELREQFQQDGYFIVPNLFSREETQALKTEIQRVLEEVRQEAITKGQDPKRVAAHGVYVGLAARSPLFRQAVRDARMADLMEAAIGPNVEFLSDKVVFKSHDKDFGTPWHQDWSYWYGTHKVSAWVPLDDATVENGCLRVLPGSYLAPVTHDGVGSEDKGFVHQLKPESVDESRAVTVELEAGGAIVFHDLTLHASHANTSGRDRWVWIPTYRDARAEDPEYSFAVATAVVRGSKG